MDVVVLADEPLPLLDLEEMPERTYAVRLEFAHGWELLNAVMERRPRLMEVAHRLVRRELDPSDLYRSIAALDEAEGLLRDALDIPMETIPENELRMLYGDR